MRFQPSKNPPEEIEKRCACCNKILPSGKQKFCNCQCKRNYHAKEGRLKALKLKESLFCMTCGKEFKPFHNRQKNCSSVCMKENNRKNNLAAYHRVELAKKACREKMAQIAEEKKQDAEEKPKKKTIHHPAIQRIIDMIKSKRQSCARFEETVGSVDYVGLMQIKHLEDKLKVMGVKYAV